MSDQEARSAAKERLERAWGDIYEQDAKEDALGKPVPVESLLDEDDFAVIREEQASSIATTESRPKRSAAAIRREHLPALAAIHERILGDIDLCHALEVVMVMAGYLTEEASNPMGAYWHGDAPDA